MGTMIAAIFVAVQAYYARSSYVQADESRFLERKLDICFDNFDDAARLDAMLRSTLPSMMEQEVWPPRVEINSEAKLLEIQKNAVPLIDDLTAGFTKASVLGPLDKFRAYLEQQANGLSKSILDLRSEQVLAKTSDVQSVLKQLSEFVGAQYAIFTGCRMIALGEA
ncbi:MAG: hypothetical protein AAF590_14070 [Pseudomonadota bacterium]